ncbi:MAG: murein transglycosylase [Symploca sp. SIO1B1]|nr:murein transglycosylase [Symploca sp. SIO1C2]NER94212.1 murein transglycosylase [Symploca sp. SIO1B1]
MKKGFTWLSLSLAIAILTASPSTQARVALQPVSSSYTQTKTNSLGFDEQLWGNLGQQGDRGALIRSIDNSLRYLNTAAAVRAYRKYPTRGITLTRVRRSLLRFRELLVTVNSPVELQAAINREFVFYKSVGNDGRGTVYFTGYFEPIYAASRRPSAEYRYPIYRKPANLASWRKPHPTRAQLEGADGMGLNSPLRGHELFWLRDRFEAFLVHIQGSSQLRLPNGSTVTVGYAGSTNYGYNSVGRELARDGRLPLDGMTLPVMSDYFRRNPSLMSQYLPRNKRFIFFKETYGQPASGSLQVPLTAERSIATDKSLMPPGALALIHAPVPFLNNGRLEYRKVSRYVLDQDTGSAIKGTGRVDYFIGTGQVAGIRAGSIGGRGELYYPLLRN